MQRARVHARCANVFFCVGDFDISPWAAAWPDVLDLPLSRCSVDDDLD